MFLPAAVCQSGRLDKLDCSVVCFLISVLESRRYFVLTVKLFAYPAGT